MDVRRCGGAGFSPAPEVMGDELGPVVAADDRAAQKSFSDRSRELNSAQRQDPLDVVSQLPEALAD